ncbi:putative palmitoyltransferase with autoacylation activity Pfa4 [Aspergillus puulaauensis]|uniref:Palmitoyltransferase PFA4 n=1 Tax=Aspergillus puulaauensis TaxID=1220207 RepID=A0A7R7XGW2_9EURO|nr:palmitoyltransferase [Aspergillus puulaauensis]BCS21200.1 palmitoyltransferase [Aspergillus puulaauensis]
MLCSSFSISRLAIPSVCTLIAFLAYTSQYFFLYFEEAPLTKDEVWRINILATCIWICYYRSCTVDPGHVPKGWAPPDRKQLEVDQASGRQRWCRRCEAFKPPRAHHCKTCGRCVPKMDHHCPWTSNCVSHFTFPHFVRFLFYAVAGIAYLESCLFQRVSKVWASRNLPSYLGPSIVQLGHLFVLFVVNSLTLFALFVLLVRTLWSLGSNTTTIESWEIERHETLLRRARHFGGFLPGPGGINVRISRQEFPYDIGIWSNIKAGMGGSFNVISWFWPLARTPDRSTGLEFEENGFEDSTVSWPPPDPDRIPLPPRAQQNGFAYGAAANMGHIDIEAFNQRNTADLRRRKAHAEVERRKPFHARFDESASDSSENDGGVPDHGSDNGEESWRNSEGERLRDFGVDEEAEFYDEEDIPLAMLMQQRAERQHHSH